ncbi:MAG: DUF3160 domain-containing protein [Magnetococcales bacterium]|nr:DUF3160 domain-containing protein [Magnetococcales bacterium]NGZ28486.1 DUF3160 domain-containing protein [Magnetococcales bacterium]
MAEENSLFPFDEWEPAVTSSPDFSAELPVGEGQEVKDVQLSPLAAEAVLLLQDGKGRQTLSRWTIGQNNIKSLPIPVGANLTGLSWHPRGSHLFALAEKAIYSLDLAQEQLSWRPIWQSKHPLHRLVVGPRPFMPGSLWDIPATNTDSNSNQDHPRTVYRLFFSQKQKDGSSWIGSIDEYGQRFYYVTATTPPPMKGPEEILPYIEPLPHAIPLSFHPVGNRLILSDAKGCFLNKPYYLDNWGSGEPLREPCGGEVAHSPNGLSLLYWHPSQAGLEVVNLSDKQRQKVAADLRFLSMPHMTADGKGIVGVVAAEGGQYQITYQPLSLPLADVVNAWMFAESPLDVQLLTSHQGLFRKLDNTQLYQLYETELYTCHMLEHRSPARPYMVTTDLFWEVYAAAYEGIFLTLERQRAIPIFIELLHQASRELAVKAPGSRMALAFATANAVMSGKSGKNKEAARVLAGKEKADSSVLGVHFDYSVFKARGHYTRNAQSRAYFKAVNYLALMRDKGSRRDGLSAEDILPLTKLSPKVISLVDKWLKVYETLIPPSRAALAWEPKRPKATYASRPMDGFYMFPLAWGWDNEVFDRVIHHEDDPMQNKQGEARIHPTGLDLATALGNPLAERLLARQGVFDAFPLLQNRLKELRTRFAEGRSGAKTSGNLYSRWLDALAEQWAANDATPISGSLWDAKRLQSGLASWATLRHATVLVNDKSGLQCGEAGFENIVMRPPRGTVEPDPATFLAIADLFATTAVQVKEQWPAKDALAQGIVRRLNESEGYVRKFAEMARKVEKGLPLAPQDYYDIHYVAGSAEHNFLVFFSLMSKEEALSNPDPIMKIADVAGSQQQGWLHVAVGRPMEWDQIVPSFGRREIVKGSVYAYHEFLREQPMTDEEWRKNVDQTSNPDWIKPYMSQSPLSCPPKQP